MYEKYYCSDVRIMMKIRSMESDIGVIESSDSRSLDFGFNS